MTRKDVTGRPIGRYTPESTDVTNTIFKFSFPISYKKDCRLVKRFSQNIVFRKNCLCLQLEAMMEVGNAALRSQAVMDTAPQDGERVQTRTNTAVDKLK